MCDQTLPHAMGPASRRRKGFTLTYARSCQPGESPAGFFEAQPVVRSGRAVHGGAARFVSLAAGFNPFPVARGPGSPPPGPEWHSGPGCPVKIRQIVGFGHHGHYEIFVIWPHGHWLPWVRGRGLDGQQILLNASCEHLNWSKTAICGIWRLISLHSTWMPPPAREPGLTSGGCPPEVRRQSGREQRYQWLRFVQNFDI
jgi:hypothetical protein